MLSVATLSFWGDVGTNLFSDLLFLSIPAASLYVWVKLSRRQLYRFFGLQPKSPRIVVHFSNVFVPRNTGRDFRGTARSFEGETVPIYELGLTQVIGELFLVASPESRSSIRRFANWLLTRNVVLEFVTSPRNGDAAQQKLAGHCTILSLGSPGYNSVSDHYLNRFEPFLQFADDNSRIMIGRGSQKGTRISGDTRKDQALLVRVEDEERDNTVFVAAGLGINGTRGALYYLVRNWRELPSHEFGICLEFPAEADDPAGHMKPAVLRRLPEALG